MTSRIRTGVVGCGTLALTGVLPHLDQSDARDKIELVAVADVVAERAAGTADRYNVPAHYSDPYELIARNDLDLVLILTPIPFHHEYAMAALESGKHVYVQKTMATTYQEAAEIVELADKNNLVLVSAPGQLLAPILQKVKDLVAQEAFGKIFWAWAMTGGWGHEFEATRHGNDVMTSIDPAWYYREGGPVQDTTVYVLHTLTGILGPVRRISAMSGTAISEREWNGKMMPVTVDDNTLMMLDFGGTTFGMVGGNSAETGRLVDWGSFGIYGSEGVVETLEIEPLSGWPERLYLKSHRGLPELNGKNQGEYGPGALSALPDCHRGIPEPHVFADIMHCVGCITGEEELVASGAHAAHVVEVIEKGYKAARSGSTLEIQSRF